MLVCCSQMCSRPCRTPLGALILELGRSFFRNIPGHRLGGADSAGVACAARGGHRGRGGNVSTPRGWAPSVRRPPCCRFPDARGDCRRASGCRSSHRREGQRAASAGLPTRPCPCGGGVLPKWPWVVQTAGLGFCGCDMAGWELTCWRAEWIMAGAPNLACNASGSRFLTVTLSLHGCIVDPYAHIRCFRTASAMLLNMVTLSVHRM
jgi:hypothetical protein